MRTTRIAIIATILGWVFASGCSSSSSGDEPGHGSLKFCTSDGDCPSGEGCDTEGGSNTDGYCTPLCTGDADCPMGYDCPGKKLNQPGECDEIGDHGGKGVCDQFDGVAGPNTC